MQKSKKIYLFLTLLFLLFSVSLTLTVLFVDVKPIGAGGTKVGLSTINKAVFDYFGVNMVFYDITDWLGIIGILTALFFFILGIAELIIRRNLLKVDKSIIFLGIIYSIVIGLYIFYEFIVVNYRPIIMPKGTRPEPSFPSSHTFITCTISITAITAINGFKIKKPWKIFFTVFFTLIILITVIGRLLSGVHWFTDILAGILYSLTLSAFYKWLTLKFTQKPRNNP